MNEQITIQGQRISYTRTSIPVSKLKLDTQNPRLQYILRQRHGEIVDSEIDAMLWGKEAVKALAQSIMQNGGVREAIIVQSLPDGSYLVKEGNCRTVASRRLLAEYPSDGRFINIPAMVFQDNLSEECLAILLADMHVAGKIQWDAFEQAKYVYDLHTKFGKPYEWLAMNLRMSKSKIKHLLLSYQQTEDYLKKYPHESIRKFSRFVEALKKQVIRSKLLSDDTFKNQFYMWLREDKLTENHHIRELPKILENEEALERLNSGTFDDAYSVIIKNDPSLSSSLFGSVKTANDYLRKASITEINDLKGDSKKIEMLQDLKNAIQNLASIAKVELV